MADKQYGGWYWRPELGKALRWWGEGIWTEGEEPSGSTTRTSISGRQTTADGSYFMTPEEVVRGADTRGRVAPFTFNWEQAEQDALEKLRPYYEELLARAQGDLTRAQGYLKEDYDRGIRYRAEDFDTATRQLAQSYETGRVQRGQDARNALGRIMESYNQGKAWNEEDLRVSLSNLDTLEPREQQQLQEAMNKREMLSSSIGVKEGGYLTGQQTSRREAVERAMQRKQQLADIGMQQGVADTTISTQRAEEGATTAYQQAQAEAERTLARGGEQATSAYERAITEGNISTSRAIEDLEEQKRQEALKMAQLERERKRDRYDVETGTFLE